MSLKHFDLRLITFFRTISVPLARFGLFLVFFWFGALKVIGESPASPLVQALFERTISFMDFGTFMGVFGIFECLIGFLFLVEGAERLVIPLLFVHMATTVMPLFLLPAATWDGFFIPTLEGQYIIKNILIIAAAILVASHVHPFAEKKVRPAAAAKKSKRGKL